MSKMTKKGVVTIPAAVRRAMGVQPGDKVVFTALTNSKARLDVMRTRIRPISHERAQELMDERTRKAPNHPEPDAEKASD
jgi:AbrB family looped-hinge helix DNA binding protein